MQPNVARVFGFLALLLISSNLNAQTYVTTYVTKVQEERESTRWTLTEWLRIKERMRIMDLWLALFSDPKKDQFRPEMDITYGMSRGTLTHSDSTVESSTVSEVTGTQGRAQLWLTNLISSTVGIRTLNIDLGGEVYQRTAGGSAAQPAATSVTATADRARALKHSYYTGNLRLFGKNIQDSSLVLKYGEYQSENSLPDWTDDDLQSHRRGKVAGAELQVYVLKWLGAEGNYLAYGDSVGAQGSNEVKGSYQDYMAFIEVSLLRLMVGRYQEDWSFANLDDQEPNTAVSESGVLFGAKLSF